jgi:hypothetical protein
MRILSFTMVCCLINCASLGQTYKYYRGNLHAHSGYSDGNKEKGNGVVKTPAGSFAFAKQSENFDFLGISEHNHRDAGMQLADYAKGIAEAKDATTAQFACLYGMEYGKQGKRLGHVLIYGVDELMGWDEGNCDILCEEGNYNALWTEIINVPGAFATLAHPQSGDFEDICNAQYNKVADKAIVGVAIMNGPHSAKNIDYKGTAPLKYLNFYKALLAAGYHLGPTIDHDNHYLTFGRMASSRTVVMAERLTPENIMDAYRKMRFYASTDWNAEVSFIINDKPMGSMFKTEGDAHISVSVSDPDANDKTPLIRVMYGQPGSKKAAKELTTKIGNTLTFMHPIPKGQEFYYYLEITQRDKDGIYTSPIWVYRKK